MLNKTENVTPETADDLRAARVRENLAAQRRVERGEDVLSNAIAERDRILSENQGPKQTGRLSYPETARSVGLSKTWVVGRIKKHRQGT